MRATFDAARGMPGRRVLLQALEDLTRTGADSPFSHRVAVRLLRDGFRPDRAPAAVETPGRVLHPDITFRANRVCVECDGLRWHRTQKDLTIDHRKDRAYRRAGWTCLRLGWWEFDHGWNGFVAELRDALTAPTERPRTGRRGGQSTCGSGRPGWSSKPWPRLGTSTLRTNSQTTWPSWL